MILVTLANFQAVGGVSEDGLGGGQGGGEGGEVLCEGGDFCGLLEEEAGIVCLCECGRGLDWPCGGKERGLRRRETESLAEGFFEPLFFLICWTAWKGTGDRSAGTMMMMAESLQGLELSLLSQLLLLLFLQSIRADSRCKRGHACRGKHRMQLDTSGRDLAGPHPGLFHSHFFTCHINQPREVMADQKPRICPETKMDRARRRRSLLLKLQRRDIGRGGRRRTDCLFFVCGKKIYY